MKDYNLPIYHARKPRHVVVEQVLGVLTIALLFITAWLWLVILG